MHAVRDDDRPRLGVGRVGQAGRDRGPSAEHAGEELPARVGLDRGADPEEATAGSVVLLEGGLLVGGEAAVGARLKEDHRAVVVELGVGELRLRVRRRMDDEVGFGDGLDRGDAGAGQGVIARGEDEQVDLLRLRRRRRLRRRSRSDRLGSRRRSRGLAHLDASRREAASRRRVLERRPAPIVGAGAHVVGAFGEVARERDLHAEVEGATCADPGQCLQADPLRERALGAPQRDPHRRALGVASRVGDATLERETRTGSRHPGWRVDRLELDPRLRRGGCRRHHIYRRSTCDRWRQQHST